jgi:uncharacterized repeat protein (TIGR01451 family)
MSNHSRTPPQTRLKLKHLLRVVFMALGLLALTLFSLLHIQQISRAQGGSLELTKRLNKSSSVVRVGEVLSFTIVLTNNASFTLTNVTLVDRYNQNVLGFAGATPAQDLHDAANGVITWTNVAAPPIGVGEPLTFTVFFTAEHPQTVVVNFVEAKDITGTMSSISDTQASDQIDEATGGSAPIFKQITPPGSVPLVGQPVTFTQIITNDGAAIMTYLPLTDTYNALFLQFHYAIPMPTVTTPPGLLVWTDLTTDFGDLAPFQSVVVTTVFTATAQVLNTVNQASVEGARDQYNNDLTANQALVPITIIDSAPAPTNDSPSEEDEEEDDDEDDVNDASVMPAPTAAATVVAGDAIAIVDSMTSQSVFSGTNAPQFLPETGYREIKSRYLILMLLVVLVLVGYILRKDRIH